MKVIYLDHPEGDFLSSLVFMGLCEEFGDDAVVDYPTKWSFRGLMHEYPSPYSLQVNPGGGRPWERDAREAPGMIGTTGPFEWMRATSSRPWSRDEVIARIGEFDLVILASPRLYNVPALEDLIAAVGRDRFPPLVMMDGEDYQMLRTDLVARLKPIVYFKRELLEGQGSGCRLEASPFATPVPAELRSTRVEKDIDVLFVGGNTWPARAEACAALAQAFGSRFVGGIRGHVAHREFLHCFARARIAVSVRGFGYDTLRRWEIPSMPGTLLVGDRLPIKCPAPLEHGVHALYFDNPEQLVEAVRCALENEPWRARLAEAGNKRIEEYHTPRARARELVRISLEEAKRHG